MIPATRSCPRAGSSSFSSSTANWACLSSVSLNPNPNSAASSNRLLFQAGPLPSAFTQYGVVGRFPP